MGFLKGILGACIGIIAGFVIIVGYIYIKVRKAVGIQDMKTLVQAAKQAKDVEQQEYSRPKTVGGITKLIEPVIIKDFGEFNKDLLFSKVEKNLISIFTAIEEKSDSIIANDDDLIYIYPYIRDKIQDIKNQNINIRYDNIKFHDHAIKNYNNSRGRATITISSSIGYIYSNDSDDYKKKKYNNIQKETRYTTQFVYVYDELQFERHEKNFSVSCPNCGAPLEFTRCR